MAKTRKVKDAIDLNTNELVYFAGHAKATYMSDGTTVEDAINNIKIGAEVDLSNYATKEELSSKQDKLVSGTNIKTINGESIIGEGDINTSSKIFLDLMECSKLSFFCVESVDIIVNGVSHTFAANSYADLTIKQDDEFEIVPTSNKSIKMLTAYPGAIDTFYDWLEGVDSFANIVFDMNSQDMYVKWNQGNQGQYHVQFAQYINCIFWSDLAYVADISIRTNYTLYNSAQLPLCYSTIPKNTFKSFYCAYGVNSDPNWANPVYKESFALATHATQVFSYYGLHSIGVFNMDADYFNITLPKDCRGLMYGAGNILNAGIFDAINVTNFGAKLGSWRDAFGYCYMLKNLYIKNLKVNLNVSWSPINQESLNFILSNAANTSKITIYLSPYTYYALTDENKTIASDKNIALSLINTNYSEDNRLSKIDISGDGTKFLSDDGTYKEICGSESDYATKEELNSKQDTITDLEVIRQGSAKGATSVQQGTLSTVATSGSYNDLNNKPELKTVATTGSYDDLINKPTIPSAVTETTVSNWGFTKNNGTYSKPNNGIPKSDLESSVQQSLSKADTALQSYTEKYTGTYSKPSGGIPKTDLVSSIQTTLTNADTAYGWGNHANAGYTKNVGTITGVSANGTSISTSGVANIPAASTSAYGVTKLSSSTSSTSTTLAATASAVKSAYDLANGKQDKLVSGTNIKTINGESLLGSGNITISSGSGSSSSENGAYAEVNHGTSDTTFTLTPNTFHVWDKVSSLTLTLGSETSGVANEYLFQFTSGSEPTTLILPDSIKFNSDFTIEENNIYQISILHGLGTIMSWDNESPLQFPINLIYGDNGELGKNVYKYLLNEYGETSFTLKEEITVNSFPLTNGSFYNGGEGTCFFFSESWGYAEIYDNGKVDYMED